MFQILKCRLYQAIYIAVWTQLVLGCGERKNVALVATDAETRSIASKMRGDVINAGWGVELCHIGMTVDDCIKNLGQPDNHTSDDYAGVDGTMSWYKLGMMVAIEDDEIVQVYFEYVSDLYSPFSGQLFSESASTNPMECVKARFGDPADVREVRLSTTDEWNGNPPGEKKFYEAHLSGKVETSYEYPKLGLDIFFLDGEVEYVRVYKPES